MPSKQQSKPKQTKGSAWETLHMSPAEKQQYVDEAAKQKKRADQHYEAAKKKDKELADMRARLIAMEEARSHPASDVGSDAARPPAAVQTAPPAQHAAAAAAAATPPAPAAPKKIMQRPQDVAQASALGAPDAASAPFNPLFVGSRKQTAESFIPKSSFKDGFKQDQRLMAQTNIRLNIIPWFENSLFKDGWSKSEAFAMTLSERFEDAKTAVQKSDHDVRHAAAHSHRILFVRRPGDYPIMIFCNLNMERQDPQFHIRLETIHSDETAKTVSNWNAAEQFIRIQGTQDELVKAQATGVQMVPLKTHWYKDSGLCSADICATEEQMARITSSFNVMTFPHSCLLSDCAPEHTATIRFRFDTESKTPTKFAHVWETAVELRKMGIVSTIRRGYLLVVASQKWSASLLERVSKLPHVHKVITDRRPADMFAVPVTEEVAADVPRDVAKKNVVKVMTTCATSINGFRDFISRVNIVGAKIVGNVTFTNVLVALEREVSEEDVRKFTAAAGTIFKVVRLADV